MLLTRNPLAPTKLSLDDENRAFDHGKRELPHWTVKTVEEGDGGTKKKGIRNAGPSKLEACAVAENGRLLIGVGSREGIWIWRIPHGRKVKRASISPEMR